MIAIRVDKLLQCDHQRPDQQLYVFMVGLLQRLRVTVIMPPPGADSLDQLVLYHYVNVQYL